MIFQDLKVNHPSSLHLSCHPLYNIITFLEMVKIIKWKYPCFQIFWIKTKLPQIPLKWLTKNDWSPLTHNICLTHAKKKKKNIRKTSDGKAMRDIKHQKYVLNRRLEISTKNWTKRTPITQLVDFSHCSFYTNNNSTQMFSWHVWAKLIKIIFYGSSPLQYSS